nr:hypothetical protein [Nanoarchaeum sp.]
MKQILFILTFLLSINFVLAVAPTIITVPSPQNLTEGVAYTYDINASDPEEGILYFSDDSNNFNIDSSTGVISFTPSNAMVGSFIAVIIVRDVEDLVDAQAINFTVNGLPSITNLADKTVQAGDEFYFDINANDPEDGINVNFFDNSSLFVINSSTGVINFTTSTAQNGTYSVTITINDSLGASSSGSFNLIINDAVTMNNLPANQTTEDSLFTLNVSSFVSNSVGTLTYSDNSSFFNINSDNGIINFTATQAMVGNHSFNISVQDNYGSNTSKIWYLNITQLNDAPTFSSIPDQNIRYPAIFSYDVNASDEENNTLSYYDDTIIFDINTNTGLINFTSSEGVVGTYTINITVNDSLGANFSDVFILTIRGNTAPVFSKNITKSLYAYDDTYTDSQFSTTNYKGSEYLRLSDVPTSFKRVYLKFNMSDVPNHADIYNSNLNLTLYSSIYTTNNISVYSINQSWDVSLITNSYQPNITNSSILNYGDIGGSESISSMNVTNTTINWLDNSSNNNGLLLKMQSESLDSGTLVYYSSDSSNSSKWPVLGVGYTLSFQNQSVNAGNNLSNVIDLDDYFYDADGDILNYTNSVSDGFNVSIDINNNVSISTSPAANGTYSVTFYANDSYNRTSSEIMYVFVNLSSDEEVVYNPGGSGGGGSGGPSQKIVSLSLDLDSNRETIIQGETLELPIIIENTGQMDISNININIESDKEELNVISDKNSISLLQIGQQDSLTMYLDSTTAPSGSYVVTITASSIAPNVNGSAVFILDVSSQAEGIEKQLVFAYDLFQTNPECLELQELLNKAEILLEEQKFEEAKSNVAVAIESCKNLIRIQESPMGEKESNSNLQQILIISGILAMTILMGYMVVRKLVYRTNSRL